MGYGQVKLLVGLGVLSGFLVCLLPVILLLFNAFVRIVVSIGVPYTRFRSPPLTTFLPVVPDLILLALLGGVLAYARLLSIQGDRFIMMGTPWGVTRQGLDDLVGIVIGTPLIWFMFQRHGIGPLFFIIGAQLLLFPFIGLMFLAGWETFYTMLVRRLITVPLETELIVLLRRTLQLHEEVAELFRVQNVVLDRPEGRLIVTGIGSEAFHQEGQKRVREIIGNVPLVTQNVREIHIYDVGSPRQMAAIMA